MNINQPHSIRILGIDPGLRHTGWGIVESTGSRLQHVAHDVIQADDQLPMAQRLSFIYERLTHILQTYSPHEAAVEEVFVNQNPLSTLKLGMARGVTLMAPAHYGISVAEYGANKIKKAIVGTGHAQKEQIETMVSFLLPGVKATKDAADALAVAICHAHYRNFKEIVLKNDR